MTLEELEKSLASRIERCVRKPITEHVQSHVFIAVDEEGHAKYVTLTEDGRIVPVEEWWG